jgi:hypothetical protein
MNNAYISKHDPLEYYIYNKEECLDYFGEDFLEEYGHEIPDELLVRYQESVKVWNGIQKELKKIVKEK